MFLFRIYVTGVQFLALTSAPPTSVTTLTTSDLTIASGESASVVVVGEILGESTYGVTILVEIAPRTGNTGTVVFTPAPPLDISQLGDPWPDVGTFVPFDTDLTGSPTRNGSVHDNGTFVPAPVTFSGALSAFPVQASADAGGVWDVLLSTAVGNSSWEGVATTLVSGTITVTSTNSVPAASGWGLAAFVLLLLSAAGVVIKRRGPHGSAA